MQRLLALYGTMEGHTATIARFIGDVARDAGWQADVVHAAEAAPDFALTPYDAVIVAASVHNRKFEDDVRDFVRTRRSALLAMPSAFVSVSMAAMRPGRLAATLEERLFRDTDWRPDARLSVAGALLYRRYTPKVRFFMRLGSWVLRGPTDTSRDHDLTDWDAVRRFTERFLAAAARRTVAAAAAGERR
ncbi:MAG: flavodoxin domain-containing protein [Dehalococcoidia bacterium]